MKKILFVCTANICRSPTAHGVFDKMIRGTEHAAEWVADSAGTHGSYSGSPPHPETAKTASERGYIYSRQLELSDFKDHALVFAMAEDHMDYMKSLCPPQHQHKLKLFLDYAPDIPGLNGEKSTPDPFGLGIRNHHTVLEMIELTMPNIIKSLGSIK